ncbi:hypothetical protein Dda_1604 [Drechslerella dactyloides]|uniref:Uncharacterized protein n=1 Tax=Drechslerella dactyloides TaxID=74499 RepID=A0AAD6J2B3_DREDA|nr:hypothetical protein Dda_1604 [Drechslerella dactyloides]
MVHVAFLAHALLELPPSLTLLFSPLSLLPPSPPDATKRPETTTSIQPGMVPAAAVTPMLRQYGAILLCSSIFALLLAITPDTILLTFPFDGNLVSSVGTRWTVHGVTAGALAGYHVLTMCRAYGRIRCGERAVVLAGGKGLGGPGVHLAAHAVVGGLLSWFAVR